MVDRGCPSAADPGERALKTISSPIEAEILEPLDMELVLLTLMVDRLLSLRLRSCQCPRSRDTMRHGLHHGGMASCLLLGFGGEPPPTM